jgi:hypothetical protein
MPLPKRRAPAAPPVKLINDLDLFLFIPYMGIMIEWTRREMP